MIRITIKMILKLLLIADNVLYSVIGKLSVIYNGGIHPKHRLINYHKFFLDRINEGESVLDIGCGNGSLSFDLSKKAKLVTGIDISIKNINIANKRFNSSNIEYICGDAVEYKYKRKYDKLVLSNVLEHIEHRIEFLSAIKDYADIILVRVPSIEREWMSLFKRELGVRYKLDKTHYIEYTLCQFTKEIDDAGLKADEMYVNYGEIYSILSKK